MRIDAAQVVAKVIETQPDKPKERVAVQPPPVDQSHLSTADRTGSSPKIPKFEVTVRYAENQVLVTTFIDQKSGETVQQIPPDQVLKIIESIQELLKESSQTRVLDTFR